MTLSQCNTSLLGCEQIKDSKPQRHPEFPNQSPIQGAILAESCKLANPTVEQFSKVPKKG